MNQPPLPEGATFEDIVYLLLIGTAFGMSVAVIISLIGSVLMNL